MSDLNPCPNCGSEPDLEERGKVFRVACWHCSSTEYITARSASGAINAWNAATGDSTMQSGKTLRDEFAMAALTGILSDRDSVLRIGKAGMDNLVCPAKLTAAGAYAIADAMLKERSK